MYNTFKKLDWLSLDVRSGTSCIVTKNKKDAAAGFRVRCL